MLVDEISLFISFDFLVFRMGFSVEKKLVIIFYYLKDIGSIIVIVNVFGVSRFIVFLIIRIVCIVINIYLGLRYFKILIGDSFNLIVNSFEEKFGFF